MFARSPGRILKNGMSQTIEAIMHLETTCTKPVVSYEEASFTKPDLRKVANSSEDQGKVGGPNGI